MPPPSYVVKAGGLVPDGGVDEGVRLIGKHVPYFCCSRNFVVSFSYCHLRLQHTHVDISAQSLSPAPLHLRSRTSRTHKQGALSTLLKLLAAAEGMDGQRRARLRHVQYETMCVLCVCVWGGDVRVCSRVLGRCGTLISHHGSGRGRRRSPSFDT